MVEILVGMIACGKSTFAQKRASQGAVIINDDAIINTIHCNNYLLYDKRLKPLYKAVENTILQIAITLGRDVVIDRPNYSKAMRRRYIGIAKSLDATPIIVLFKDCGVDVHVSRRMNSDARGHTAAYWTKVYNKHKSLYEPPDELEGADCVAR